VSRLAIVNRFGAGQGDPGFLDFIKKIPGFARTVIGGIIPRPGPFGGPPAAGRPGVLLPRAGAGATQAGALGLPGGALGKKIAKVLASLPPRVKVAGGIAVGAGAAAFGLEQVLERLGVRGGAGLIGRDPRRVNLANEIAMRGGAFRLPRRRMNVLNPRALRRSLRRVSGFEKFVKRSFRLSGLVRTKKRSAGHGHRIVSKR